MVVAIHGGDEMIDIIISKVESLLNQSPYDSFMIKPILKQLYQLKEDIDKKHVLLELYRDMRRNTGYKHLPELILEKIKLKEKELEDLK